MKTIILLLAAWGVMITQTAAQAPLPAEGWPYVTKCLDFGIWMIPQLGLDEGQMHLFFNARTGEVDKFELNGSFSANWPIIYDSTIFPEPSIILDIDHDNKNEIAVKGRGTIDGQLRYSLYLFDDNGTIMPGFPVFTANTTLVNANDCDGDNEYEFMFYDFDNNLIYCIDRFGNSKPGWPIYFTLPNPPHTKTNWTAIGDIDLDDKNEFLLVSLRYIYAFKYDGTIENGFPIVLREDTTYGYWNGSGAPILADVDNDGYPEIITSGFNYDIQAPISFIIIYEHDGTIKDGWPKYIDNKIIQCPVTPSDINGDGRLELGFQMDDSLTFTDMNLNPLPGWPAYPTAPDGEIGTATSDPIIVDVDGDGDQEIFFNRGNFYPDSMGQDSTWYYGHGNQFGLDHLGQPLNGFPFKIRGSIFGRPPTFALEPNSYQLYMAIAPQFFVPTIEADTLFVELYRFPDSTGVPNQWPMLSHDNLMTRNYNFVDRVTAIAADAPSPLPKSAILKQNYPNPFNSSTIIEYTLPKREQVTVSVYDILGRKIKNIDEGIYPAGARQISLNMGDYTSGIYYLALNTEDTRITRKLILLK
jgi:hypothetical protein